ncbi:MAG: T9SS type A sorting domain-containing protein [Saprospiraceae bacterium]|nr:T9SS type A sorting domain-containing protein [Saprospiraceae bacterium]
MIKTLSSKLFILSQISKFICIFLLFVVTAFHLTSQELKYLDIKVIQGGKILAFAVAGGINNAQVSEGDINQDGILDLVIFDRTGNVITPFIYNPTSKIYEYAQSYKQYFPAVQDWLIMKDFDSDGIPDLFASSFNTQIVPGIEVYKGRYENGHIAFSIFQTFGTRNILYFPIGSGISQIPVDYSDVPAFDDIDHDGDMDILTFEPGSNQVTWFQNVVKERGFKKDTLAFIYRERCYGGFVESGLNSDIKLSNSKDSCASGFHSNNNKRHAGSTILSIDLDDDYDQDMIVGDLSSDKIIALYNGGSSQDAWMNRMDSHWNSEDKTFSMKLFPAAFAADIDHDGNRDILISPNIGSGDNINNLWYYRKIIGILGPHYQYIQNNLFADEMVDWGFGTHPVFVDYNQDGLQDIIVGTEGILTGGSQLKAGLILYENTGTILNPEYTLKDEDYLGFNSLSELNQLNYFAPSFGDIDGDGDLDMLVGTNEGSLIFCKNNAGPGNVFSFAKPIFDFQNISLASYISPQLIDLNRDGLLDIVIGTRVNNNQNGNACGSFFYFKNTGTKISPKFDPAGTTNCLGMALLDSYGSRVHACPFVVDFNNSFALFAGNIFGNIYLFSEIENNLDGKFKLVSSDFGKLREGENAHISIADIDNDHILEMVVGNRRGGISFYKTHYRTDGTIVSTKEIPQVNVPQITPNPVQNVLHIYHNYSDNINWKIYNLLGLPVLQNGANNTADEINVSSLPSGSYFIQINQNNQVSTYQFVKN